MAKYELPIYGENNTTVKEYKTDHLPWGVYLDAAAADEKMKTEKQSPLEQLETVNGIIKQLFIGLTDEELKRADADDIFNTFRQITAKGNDIAGKN